MCYEKTSLSTLGLRAYAAEYGGRFQVYRHCNTDRVSQYLQGLFHEGKHNIERMSERIAGSDYQQLHHFISESPWDHEYVLQGVRPDISALFEKRAELRGLLLDESGHRKRGQHSVGVGRQYLGSIGKVDNGQVAVLAALSQGDDVALLDTRLYLPKSWTRDAKRCKKAGIPEGERHYRTKPELALEMVARMGDQIKYDWVGADSIYGNSIKLRTGLTQLGKLYVMDIGEEQFVYLTAPQPYIPTSSSVKGRPKSTYISDVEPLKVKDVIASLKESQWKTYTLRQGTKGPMIRQVTCLEVFVWKAKRPNTNQVESVRLIISRNPDGTHVKYSLTNDIALKDQSRLSDWGAVYRQMQRYWVERAIQNCKDSLGMAQYQVRKWMAWYHHMTLTIMALHYILIQKLEHEHHIPLLSVPDIKFYLAQTLPKKASQTDQVWSLILKRHEQRAADLKRFNNLK